MADNEKLHVAMADDEKLHVAMFPWLAFGHLIPYLELSKLIAEKGHRISFISTPRNIERLPKIPLHLSPLIKFVEFPLPHDDNLPPEAEATIDVPYDKVPYLKQAHDGLEEGLTRFLESSNPDWIVHDFAPHWLPPITTRLGISSAYFSIFLASSMCFFGLASELLNVKDGRWKPEHFTVPPKWIPFPSKVAYRLHEAKKMLDYHIQLDSGVTDKFRFSSTILGSNVMAIRSCMELEAEYLLLARELNCKPVVPIGLLPPSISGGDEGVDEAWVTISEWLNKQKKKSVVYIALGSEVTMSQDEATELAFGLELSGLPFFWVLRKRQHDYSVELPDGFEERIKGRGVVWRSWAPQLKILADESIGGFLTHCGYSSVIEALSFGHALIMLPFSADQALIARVFEDKKVGMEVPRSEENGSYTRNSLAESLKKVMVEEEGQTCRDQAKEMMKMFGDRGLHDRYVDNFVEYLQNHRVSRQDKQK